MEFARAFDLAELCFDLGKTFLDHPPVRFELRFAGAAKKTEAAALPLEMGPGPDQTAFLIRQMCVLDLQRAFARTRTPAKDFEDQAGAIKHLGAPSLFQIALLHRRERAVHHHDASFVGFNETGDLLDLAFAEIRRRAQGAEHHDAGLCHVEIDGAGKADGLVKPRHRARDPSAPPAPPSAVRPAR